MTKPRDQNGRGVLYRNPYFASRAAPMMPDW